MSGRYMQYQEEIRTAHTSRGESISNRACQRLARHRMQAEDGFVRREHDKPAQTMPVRRRQSHEIDPTYQQAVHNLTCAAEECDRCGRSTKKHGPETVSTKTRLEAA